MSGKVCGLAPPVLAVLTMFSFLFVLLGRESFVSKDFPAFLSLNNKLLHVELVGTDAPSGVYQINDGLTLEGVIKLTNMKLLNDLTIERAWTKPLQNGERIEIISKDQKVRHLQRGWMPASHRVSMGIPLHPDRMSSEDWKFLSGVGEAMAGKIENNRQQNGDFASLEGLLRVKGIGKKSIDKWRMFFVGR
jgi:competence protein ComEA